VGNRLEVVVIGYGQRHEQIVESLSPLSVDVMELNLEDAFIEYTRGQRRGLPLLAVERQLAERV
jgi:ABC-2 type transport system ATP-binding protein